MIKNPLDCKCPSHEQLSEYFDQESPFQNEIEQHIAKCADCHAYLLSLKKLDQSIKKSVNESLGCDENIAKRITARVKISLKEEEKEKSGFFLFSPVVWRAGVLVLIGFVICCLLWRESRQEEIKDIQGNHIRKSARVSASFVSGPTVVKSELKQKEMLAVQQKWAVPEVINISAFLNEQEKTTTFLECRKTNAGWQIICIFSERQLQIFMKLCQKKGFKLLISTPDLMQIAESGEKFYYKAKFVSFK